MTVVALMPRHKLSRKAKKSRVNVYSKASDEKMKKKDDTVQVTNCPPVETMNPPEPAVSSPSHSITTTEAHSPVVVSMATCSPSLHDLTVTYDYSADEVPQSSHPLTTDRFMALFPFTESPTAQRLNSKGGCLWTDLSPTAKVRKHHRHRQQTDNSSDLHQLNVIANKIRETMNEHQTAVQDSMTFDPQPATRLDFSDDDSDESTCDMDAETNGGKECEDDWFWSQVALKTDTTNVKSGSTSNSKSRVSTTERGVAKNRVADTKGALSDKHMVNKTKVSIQRANAGPSTSRHTALNGPRDRRLPTHSAVARPSTNRAVGPCTGLQASHKNNRLESSKTSTQATTPSDDWSASGDNDFIDQLLTQGVSLGVTPQRTRGNSLRPREPCIGAGPLRPQAVCVGPTQRIGSRPVTKQVQIKPANSVSQASKQFQPRLNHAPVRVQPKCSPEEIERKKALAKQRLQAKLKNR